MRRLASTMLRVGLVGFGGGSALIPVLHQEAVENERLVSEEEFNKNVVVATITPGALPVEIAAGIGWKLAGVAGMLLGAAAIALPGVIIVVLACALFNGLGYALSRQIDFLAIGVSGYIIAVMLDYVESTLLIERERGRLRYGVPIILLTFALTCGKQLHRLLEWSGDHLTVFGVSTVDLMGVTLFLIFWNRGTFKLQRVIPAIAIALMYCLSLGGLGGLVFGVFDLAWLRAVLRMAMFVMAGFGVCQSFRESRKGELASPVPMLVECAICLAFVIAAGIVAGALGRQGLLYVMRGCLSSLLSFGGGDAYLAIAGGMFVSGGLVAYQSFYSLLVSVANASPGSILCEVLSGVGYFLGLSITGSPLGGFALAACGFACSIAMSCITFSFANYLYEQFEDLSIFDSLRRLIRPIISGLLLTVVLGFLYNCLMVGSSASWPDWLAVAICIVLAFANRHVGKRFSVKPLYVVFASAALSLAVCNILLLVP